MDNWHYKTKLWKAIEWRACTRVYVDVGCLSAARLPFISVWPQARKNTFWHQQLKAWAHASGTKVSLILPIKSLPPFLSLSPSLPLSPGLSAPRLHTDSFSLFVWLDGLLDYFISLCPSLFRFDFKGPSICLIKLQRLARVLRRNTVKVLSTANDSIYSSTNAFY